MHYAMLTISLYNTSYALHACLRCCTRHKYNKGKKQNKGTINVPKFNTKAYFPLGGFGGLTGLRALIILASESLIASLTLDSD